MNNFPVEDISHKPKRMQGDAIKQKFQETIEEVHGNSIPKFITLEKAIEYYEKAAGENKLESKLYAQTAEWLKELLTIHNRQKLLEE